MIKCRFGFAFTVLCALTKSALGVGWLPVEEGERVCGGVRFVPVWTYRLLTGALCGLVNNRVCVTTSSELLVQRRLITQRDNTSTTWCPLLRPLSLSLAVTWMADSLSCRYTKTVKKAGSKTGLFACFLSFS